MIVSTVLSVRSRWAGIGAAGPDRRTEQGGLSGETGSGSIAGAAGVVFAAAVMCAILPLGGALADLEALRGAADAGALAAADTSSGRVPGSPCGNAEAVARRVRVDLGECSVAEGIAEITTVTTVMGVLVVARARAGPPVAP